MIKIIGIEVIIPMHCTTNNRNEDRIEVVVQRVAKIIMQYIDI